MSNSIIEFYEDVAKKIHGFEVDAKQALADDNPELYKKMMEQKAQILASLEIEGKKFDVSSLSGKAQLFIKQKIEDFTGPAKMALRFNSPWFMSQLLFSQDYKDGDPNNFDFFLARLKEIQ